MNISFAKKHVIALILALLIFSFLVYLALAAYFKPSAGQYLHADITVDQAGQPVKDYKAASGRLIEDWKVQWDEADAYDTRVELAGQLRQGLQNIVISGADKVDHLENVLAASKLEQAVRDRDQALIQALIEQLSDVN